MTDQVSKNEQEQEADLRTSVTQKMLELITAALSLVAALAWNDAIQTLFSKVFGPASGLAAKFLYAIVVTILAVSVILRLHRLSRKMNGSHAPQPKKNS